MIPVKLVVWIIVWEGLLEGGFLTDSCKWTLIATSNRAET